MISLHVGIVWKRELALYASCQNLTHCTDSIHFFQQISVGTTMVIRKISTLVKFTATLIIRVILLLNFPKRSREGVTCPRLLDQSWEWYLGHLTNLMFSIKFYVSHQTVQSFLGYNVTVYLLFLCVFYIVTLVGKRNSKIGSSHIHSPRQLFVSDLKTRLCI